MRGRVLHPYPAAGDWQSHESGVRSRGLPDRLPVIDPTHGFRPPFAVDLFELGSSETLEVFQTIPEAARFASRLVNRHRYARGFSVEMTDQSRRKL